MKKPRSRAAQETLTLVEAATIQRRPAELLTKPQRPREARKAQWSRWTCHNIHIHAKYKYCIGPHAFRRAPTHKHDPPPRIRKRGKFFCFATAELFEHSGLCCCPTAFLLFLESCSAFCLHNTCAPGNWRRPCCCYFKTFHVTTCGKASRSLCFQNVMFTSMSLSNP